MECIPSIFIIQTGTVWWLKATVSTTKGVMGWCHSTGQDVLLKAYRLPSDLFRIDRRGNNPWCISYCNNKGGYNCKMQSRFQWLPLGCKNNMTSERCGMVERIPVPETSAW